MNLTNILAPAMLNPRSYEAYRSVVAELVKQQKTTGPEQSEQRIAYTKLNLQRMKRVEKQFVLLPELAELLQVHQPEWDWVVLSEAWCGDGAQLVPALAAIAAAAPGIRFRVLLRDENANWMDTCLTNGSRSIPKLVCSAVKTGERLFTWGPRPAAIQEQMSRFKLENPAATAEETALHLHTLYTKDQSQALQQDMLMLCRRALLVAENTLVV